MSDTSELSNETLCRRLAAAMGWEVHCWSDDYGVITLRVPPGDLLCEWAPLDDLHDAAEAEAEVANRGLKIKYAIALLAAVGKTHSSKICDMVWCCATANARTRAECCLRVLEAGKGGV